MGRLGYEGPMALRVLVLHGPNLSLVSEGARTLAVFEAELEARAVALGIELETFQANGEGQLLDELQDRREWFDAVVVNPSSLAPVAYGLADALALIGKPCVEVLLMHEAKGRGKSALRAVVDKQFHGQGFAGYLKALEAVAKKTAAPPTEQEKLLRAAADTAVTSSSADELARLARTTKPERAAVRQREEEAPNEPSAAQRAEERAGGGETQPPPRTRAIGRSGVAEQSPPSPRPEKSIGRRGEVPTVVARPGKTIGKRAAEPEAPAKAAGRKPAESGVPGKSIGRGSGAGAAARVLLTRAQVKAKISDCLAGRIPPEALAAWSRGHWQALQTGTEVEAGQHELLDEVLLLLSASAKATDHVLLSYMAKLG